MLNSVEFYRSWMVELLPAEYGVQGVCHSPNGKQMGLGICYASPELAWQAAMEQIDRFHACHALNRYLYELYDAGRLSFEIWQSLSQSLQKTACNAFTQSPS
jgi:hypothetical protein